MAHVPAKPPAKTVQDRDARRDRLREALRDNLKRRKAQLRGRNQASDPPTCDDGSSGTG